MQFLAISLLQRIITQSRDSAVRREKGIISNFLCIRIREMTIAKQPYSVIGNTPDFDSVFPGSSPGRATSWVYTKVWGRGIFFKKLVSSYPHWAMTRRR